MKNASRVVIADEVAFAPPAHRKVLMLNTNGILETIAERIVGKYPWLSTPILM